MDQFTVPHDIGELISKRDELQRRAKVGSVTCQAYKNNLDSLLSNLTDAKLKGTHLSALWKNLGLLLSNLDARVSSLRSASLEKESTVGQLRNLFSLDGNVILHSKSSLKQLDQSRQKLELGRQNSPWIPEKHELLRELNNGTVKLAKVEQDVRALQQTIEDRKRIIDGHNRLPFRTFCIQELASFYYQNSRMRELWKIENEKKRQLEAKLAELGPSQNDLSFFLNQRDSNVPIMRVDEVSKPSRDADRAVEEPIQEDQEQGEEDVNMEDAIEQPVFQAPATPTNNRSIQIVDYEDSDQSTPVGNKMKGSKSSSVPVERMEEDEIEQSVLERDINEQLDDSPQEFAASQQSTTKDVFPCQVEFSFAGAGALDSQDGANDLVVENFLDLMDSMSQDDGGGGGDAGNNIFDFLGGNQNSKDDGGGKKKSKNAEEQAFSFNFGGFGNNSGTAEDDSTMFGGNKKSFF